MILLQRYAHKLAHAVYHLGDVFNAHKSGRHADLRRKLDKLLQNGRLLRLFLRPNAQLDGNGKITLEVLRVDLVALGREILQVRAAEQPETLHNVFQNVFPALSNDVCHVLLALLGQTGDSLDASSRLIEAIRINALVVAGNAGNTLCPAF